MGLLNASMYGSYAPGTGVKPPAMPQQQPMMPPMQRGMGPASNNDFLSAFASNPQFMQQLQAMQNGQGPGRQAPQFTPPPMQMSTSMQGMGGQGQVPARGYGLSDRAGYDALAFLRGTAF